MSIDLRDLPVSRIPFHCRKVIDFGFANLLAKGSVVLKSDVEVTNIMDDSVILSDSSEQKADAIIYA